MCGERDAVHLLSSGSASFDLSRVQRVQGHSRSAQWLPEPAYGLYCGGAPGLAKGGAWGRAAAETNAGLENTLLLCL